MRYNDVFQLFRKKQTCIFILGMHRSGTSCLAGSLQQYGLYLGEVFEQNPHNKKGNRENKQIMDLNNALLEYNCGSWDNPPSQIRWNDDLAIKRDLIIRKFKDSAFTIWGFKDPRTIITLPFWLNKIRNFKFVGSFRNPVSVAESLMKRNGLDQEKAYKLWLEYNEKLLQLQALYSFPLISFDLSEDEYELNIHQIAEYLQLPKMTEKEKVGFFDQSLRNHTVQPDIGKSIPENILGVYNELIRAYENQFF